MRPARVGDRIGPWELLDQLGRGSLGTVWLARGDGDAVVALKLLASDAAGVEMARLAREVQLLQQLNAEGPGFVPLLGSGDSPLGLWLAMPLLAGTLRTRLQQGPLTPGEAVDLVRGLAEAIGRAHARGVVHRDLKPENVLLDAHGRPYVADLGLAKLMDSRAVGLSLTQDQRGTAGYAAPEQQRDAKRVGPPADVFSLGAILYECLCGAPAFLGGSALDLLRQMEEERRVAPRQVPRWLRPVLERCLRVDPGLRYPDGAALAAALTPPATSGWSPSRWALQAGLTLVLCAGAGAGGLAFGRRQGAAAALAALGDGDSAAALDSAAAFRDGGSAAGASATPSAPASRSAPIQPVVSADGRVAAHDAAGWARLAATREATGDTVGALELLDRAVERFSHDPGLLERRGRLRRKAGDEPGGARDLARAAELEPDEARRWNLLGVALDETGHTVAALEHYDRALELDPGFVRARVNRANLRRRSGDLAGAEKDAQEALRRDPRDVLAHMAHGHVLRGLERESEAIEAFSRALELDRALPEALEQRGYLYGRQGRYLEEVQDMTRLLELEPERSVSWANRGWARLRLGDAEGAIPDFTRAIEIAADPTPGWFHERAKAHQALGHFDLARADYEEFIRRAPDDDRRVADAKKQLEALRAR